VTWAPDEGWRYHPKHVQQFTDINKLYIVASCWIITATYRTISHISSDTALTPRNTVIFEKLTVAKQLKIFQAFNGTPNVHSRVHNSPPMDPILNQINLIQTFTHCLEKGKSEGKGHPKTGHEVTEGGIQVYLYSFFNLCARWGLG